MVLQTKTSNKSYFMTLSRVLAMQMVRCVAKGVERRTRMTSQQIEYAKHLEQKRHNIASEGVESTKAETQRYVAKSSDAHYQRQDSTNWYTALYSKEAAMKQADAAWKRAEVEEAKLPNDMLRAKASYLQALASSGQVEVQRSALGESIRHNQVLEDQNQQGIIDAWELKNAQLDLDNRQAEEQRRKNLMDQEQKAYALETDRLRVNNQIALDRAKLTHQVLTDMFSDTTGLGRTILGNALAIK